MRFAELFLYRMELFGRHKQPHPRQDDIPYGRRIQGDKYAFGIWPCDDEKVMFYEKI